MNLFAGCLSVRLLEDSVIPPHALRGQKAVMRCNYDLEGDRLYSVKWYFNQKEFYRYIPSDNPQVTIFNNHPGVNVIVSFKKIYRVGQIKRNGFWNSSDGSFKIFHFAFYEIKK